MNDFKSYSGGQPQNNFHNSQNGAGNGNGGGANGATPPEVNNTVEMAKILTKAMSGKNEAQILQTIIAEAERGKREGTLTNADLDNFYNALSPMLDGFKKRKLRDVIVRLKNI